MSMLCRGLTHKHVPMPLAQQAQAQAGLVVAETALGLAGVVEQQIAAAKAAQAVPAAK